MRGASLVIQMVQNLPAMKETQVQSLGLNWDWVSGKVPWRRKWQPTPVFLPGESHGQRSLVGYSPWGRQDSQTAELLTLKLPIGVLTFTQENKLFQVSSFHYYQYFITSILLTM